MSEVKLILGDALDVLREMEPGSVDAVVTDPPYGVNAAAWDRESPYEILPELLRVSSGLVLWFGAAPRIQTDLENFPVSPQRILIWYVTFSMAGTRAHGMFYRYHPIYAWNLPKTQSGIQMDVISQGSDAGNGNRAWWHHPGTKPLQLMRRLVRMVEPGALILDPFLGSGTTAVAAILEGRRAIGIEIDPEYFKVAERRIAQAQAQPPLIPHEAQTTPIQHSILEAI